MAHMWSLTSNVPLEACGLVDLTQTISFQQRMVRSTARSWRQQLVAIPNSKKQGVGRHEQFSPKECLMETALCCWNREK